MQLKQKYKRVRERVESLQQCHQSQK